MRHLGLVQALIQLDLDTDIYLSLIEKALYDLKQIVRAWYQLLSSSLMECAFEQSLVNPFVFQPLVVGDVVAILVFHVDDINTAATEKVAELVISAPNQRYPNISQYIYIYIGR